MPRAQLKPADTIRIERRRFRAEKLLIRHVFERMELKQAWRDVCPESKCTSKSAKTQAGAEIDWYKANFPTETRTILHLHRMGEFDMVRELVAIFEGATLPAKDPKTGGIVDSGFPDWKTRLEAMNKLMVFGGFMSRRGGASGPATAPLPTSLPGDSVAPDGANGSPMQIDAPKKIVDPEEWKRNFDTHEQQRRQDQRSAEEEAEREVAEADSSHTEPKVATVLI